MSCLKSLYASDYASWASHNIDLLTSRRFDELDIEHLIEELSDMGRSERRELINRLRVLLAHLLKWEYQLATLSNRWAEFEGKSWRNTIIEQRSAITYLMKQSPGLRSFMDEAVREGYQEAIDLTVKETEMERTVFPSTCPYSVAQVLNDGFFPSQRSGN